MENFKSVLLQGDAEKHVFDFDLNISENTHNTDFVEVEPKE